VDSSPKVQRLERKVEHSLQFNAEVKNRWSYTTIPYTLIINAREILHLHLLETNITSSLVLTTEVRERWLKKLES
jgi:hypothetical protein